MPIARWLPIVGWLPGYERSWLRPDLLAGVSTWALVVPQAVAYGAIAGLSPQAGLAAAFAGPLGYAMLGTSRQLMVSPTSSTAAISAGLAGPMANGDPLRFAALSAMLALLTGAVFIVLGLFKVGFVSQFLALSVQVGFMFGLGLTIAVGQLFKLLGLPPPPDGSNFLPSAWLLINELGLVNPATAMVGVGSLVALLALRRAAPRVPAALVVVAAATAITGVLHLDAHGVSTVGPIPGGLPLPAIPAVDPSDILALLPVAAALAIVGYAESASVAQDFATQHRYDIDPDQELIAVGGANALSGLLQAFMVAGGASQSAGNDRAGARSQVASLVVAGLALLTALFLTPLFFYLPDAALAAIVISAVLGFFRVAELLRLRRMRRQSFSLAIASMLGVLVLGMLSGLLLSIGLSIILLLSYLARPTISVLGQTSDGRALVDLEVDEQARPLPSTLILRPNAPLMFLNVRGVRTHVLDRVRDVSPDPPLRLVLLELSMTARLDVEVLDTLKELRSTLHENRLQLGLCNLRAEPRSEVEQSGYFVSLQSGSAPDAGVVLEAQSVSSRVYV